MLRKHRTLLVALTAAVASAATTIALMPAASTAAGSRAHVRADNGGRPPGPPVVGLAMAALHPDRKAGGPPPAAGERPSRSALFAAIGDKLGKSGDDVGAAVRAAIVKRLDQAVSDGKLTSDQRDEILKRWDADTPPDGPAGGPPPGPPCRGHGRPPKDAAKQIAAFRADVADSLGVSTDDLVSAIDAAAPSRR